MCVGLCGVGHPIRGTEGATDDDDDGGREGGREQQHLLGRRFIHGWLVLAVKAMSTCLFAWVWCGPCCWSVCVGVVCGGHQNDEGWRPMGEAMCRCVVCDCGAERLGAGFPLHPPIHKEELFLYVVCACVC